MQKINKQNFINNLNNQYQQFLNKSENYLKLLVSANKLAKGTKEFLIVKFVHDQILRFKYGKRELLNLPASRILAKIIHCSHSYILKVINKWSNSAYGIFEISKNNRKKYIVGLHSTVTTIIHKDGKRLNFDYLPLFLFKTKKYKELLNEIQIRKNNNWWSI